MNKWTRVAAVAATLSGGLGGALGAGLLAASPAVAAQAEQSGTCDGVTVTITTPSQNSSDHGGWTVGQVVGSHGQHYIPTAFELAVTDQATGVTYSLSGMVKGNGNANHNQQTVTCTFPDTDPADAGLTMGDVEGFIGQTLDGANPSDPAALTFNVSAVPKG